MRRRIQTEPEPDVDPLETMVFELLDPATSEVLSQTGRNLTSGRGTIRRGVPEPAEPTANLPPAPDEIFAAEDEFDEDLDGLDSPALLCRWPNGEFSIVTGTTKREAIINLDEWPPHIRNTFILSTMTSYATSGSMRRARSI